MYLPTVRLHCIENRVRSYRWKVSLFAVKLILIHSATDEGIPLRVPHMLLKIPSETRSYLARMETEVAALLKEELLHYLLYWKPIRLPTVELVESLLRSLTPPSLSDFEKTSPITIVSLSFVRQKKCFDLIYQEMTKLDLSPMRIRTIGRYFVAEFPQNDDSHDFWLFFTLERNSVLIFFSLKDGPSETKTMLLQRARGAILKTCHRVNQLALLGELNETRYCRYCSGRRYLLIL